MATNKKATKASKSVKSASVPAATPAPEKKVRNRPTVLVKKTAKQLIELLGGDDIAIGVSRKELTVFLTRKKAAAISAALDEE